MFSIDNFNNLEPLSIYILKPSGEVLGCLDDEIVESSASLTIGINQRYELSFTMNRAANSSPSWYDYVLEGMYLSVDKIGIFKICQPPETFDNIKDEKSVTAYSCDSELDDKTIQLSLNMGTEESQEYLVVYDDGEEESLVNPYTGIPYDWLVLYNTFPEQLQVVLSQYNSGHYGSKASNGDTVITSTSLIEEVDTLCNLIPRIKNRLVEVTGNDGYPDYELEEWVIYEYSDDGESISSITLTGDFASRVNYLISFYTKYRDQLSLLSVVLEKTDSNWTVGNIYGVSDGDYTLANKKYQFETDETIYAFLTDTLAQTINCIVNFDIVNRKVNVTPVEEIGEDTGISLSYDNLINSLNIESDDESLCTRLYVTGADDLGIEQVNFGLPYIDDLSYKINVRDVYGERIYVTDDLAEKYEQFVNYRDSLRDEYVQLSKEYNEYTEEIYELMYRVPNDILSTDWSTYSVEELETSLTAYKNALAALITLYKEDYGDAGLNSDGSVNENYMRNTMYWYDYVAYQGIIANIECAISVYPNYSDQDKWTDSQKAAYEDKISAWETEWTLYGIVELQAKIETYTQNMEILVGTAVILKESGSEEIKKWNELTDAEKTDFGNLESNYYYDTYMKYYDLKQSAQEYLDTLQAQKEEMEAAQQKVQDRRNEIVKNVTMSTYFTTEECKILNRLLREYTYTNENILVTSLNNTVDTVDVQYELLEDGIEQASIQSRPQLNFSTTLDNLFGITEFESLWNSFQPGNYMMVQYRDDTYVKLRMVSYVFNPCLPSSDDLTITFSNYIRSQNGLSDIESMLGLAGSSSGSSGSGGAGSGSGLDDIDELTNTMLNKLLSSETFGTRVTNVILDTLDANTITARYATFNGLANGITTIDGACIQTGVIKSNNYNGSGESLNNTKGSIIKLDDGTFNFGGGGLVWDGNDLKVSNASITATNNINTITIDPDSSNLFKISKNNDDLLWVDSNGTLHITGDGSGLDISSNDSVTGLAHEFEVTAGELNSKISDLNGNYSVIKQTVDTLTSRVEDDEGNYSTITQTSEAIESAVSDANGYTDSVYKQTSEEISSAVTKANSYTNSLVKQTSDEWSVTLSDNYATKASLVLSLENGVGKLSANADHIYLSGHQLVVECDNFKLDSSGNVELSGVITAQSGSKIGPWSVSSSAIYYGNASYLGSGIYFGTSGLSLSSVFSISSVGELNSNANATFAGGVNAYDIHIQAGDLHFTSSDGSIGYCTLDASKDSLTIAGGTSVAANENCSLTVNGSLSFLDNSGGNVLPAIATWSSSNTERRIAWISSRYGTPSNYSEPVYYIRVKGEFDSSSGYVEADFASTSSDIRLKSNIEDTEVEALPLIRDIKVRQFDWKRDENHQSIGFVADELEELDPALSIGGGYDEETGDMVIKSVNTFYLLGYTVKAVQELDSTQQSTDSRITDLESQIDELKSQIAKLQSMS